MNITEHPDGRVVIDTGRQPATKGATWDGETVSGVVVKADEELRYTLAVAYPANRADTATAADGHRDFASKEALRKAAHYFLRNGGQVGVFHKDGTEGAGENVESFLWPDGAPDWPTVSGYIVKSGDWMVGTIWSEPTWQEIKAARLGGVSMQGKALRGSASPGQIAALRS